jgi:hypothetical protein
VSVSYQTQISIGRLGNYGELAGYDPRCPSVYQGIRVASAIINLLCSMAAIHRAKIALVVTARRN